jgi:RNA polymerase sigma-70 factor (ECF subfamily)
MGNEADARDVTQAIFVRAWTGLPGLTDPDRFAAWFGRILVNTCRTSMRGRRQRMVREIPLSGLPDAGESLVDGSDRFDTATAAADRLDRAIDRLSVAERTILALHHHDGLSLGELSERLSVPPKTCKSRLFTARRALERALAAEDV